MRTQILIVLVSGATLFAQTPKPAEAPKPPPPKQVRVKAEYVTDVNNMIHDVTSQIEIRRLKACSEAGIPHDRCRVNWETGIAEEKEEPKK